MIEWFFLSCYISIIYKNLFLLDFFLVVEIKTKTNNKMKYTPQFWILLLASLATPSMADDIPTGSLTIGNDVDAVVEGSRPQISWEINYPGPPVDEDLITTTETNVSIQMLGTSIVVKGVKRFTNTEMSFSNESGWHHVFQGIDTDVNVNQVLVHKSLPENTQIGFRTQKETSSGGVSSWRYFEPSDTDNHHVKVLRDGTALPWVGEANSQRQIGDFLAAYLNEAQTHVVLDDNQVIMAVEMGTTSPGDTGYDMQDVIVLLTFTETTETVVAP